MGMATGILSCTSSSGSAVTRAPPPSLAGMHAHSTLYASFPSLASFAVSMWTLGGNLAEDPRSRERSSTRKFAARLRCAHSATTSSTSLRLMEALLSLHDRPHRLRPCRREQSIAKHLPSHDIIDPAEAGPVHIMMYNY